MNKIIIILMIGLVMLVAACARDTPYYQNPQAAQQQPSGQYVGGGCGVAPQNDYQEIDMQVISGA